MSEASVMDERKEIPLSQGKVAIVDAADYEFLSQFHWFAWKGQTHTTFYAVRNVAPGETGSRYMHRLVLGLTDSKIKTDHRDGDGLHNWRENLRHANHQQNSCNRGRQRSNRSGYKGVSRYGRKWVAHITADRKHKNIGYFSTPEAAARAYDAEASRLHGEFACLNFPQEASCQS